MEVLLENKREYTEHLCDVLSASLWKQLDNVYNTVKKAPNVLKVFQKALEDLPKWNVDVVARLLEAVQTESACDYLGDLVKAIFTVGMQVHMKQVDSKVVNIKVRIPTLEVFVHRCLVEYARAIWKRPYLYYHGVRSLERQKNLVQCERLVRKAITTVLRTSLPMNDLASAVSRHALIEGGSKNTNVSDDDESTVTEESEEDADDNIDHSHMDSIVEGSDRHDESDGPDESDEADGPNESDGPHGHNGSDGLHGSNVLDESDEPDVLDESNVLDESDEPDVLDESDKPDVLDESDEPDVPDQSHGPDVMDGFDGSKHTIVLVEPAVTYIDDPNNEPNNEPFDAQIVKSKDESIDVSIGEPIIEPTCDLVVEPIVGSPLIPDVQAQTAKLFNSPVENVKHILIHDDAVQNVNHTKPRRRDHSHGIRKSRPVQDAFF